MPPVIRNATPDDASFLVHVIDWASAGLLPVLWAEMVPDGVDGMSVGRGLVAQEQGEFSYRHGVVLEQDGERIGGLIGYPLPSNPTADTDEIPEAFLAIVELVNLVRGFWYIHFMAIDPKVRRNGLGTALLNEAEQRARASRCPGLALIVSSSNTPALNAYRKAGYEEHARRVMDLSGFGFDTTDALLMVKVF